MARHDATRGKFSVAMDKMDAELAMHIVLDENLGKLLKTHGRYFRLKILTINEAVVSKCCQLSRYLVQISDNDLRFG